MLCFACSVNEPEIGGSHQRRAAAGTPMAKEGGKVGREVAHGRLNERRKEEEQKSLIRPRESSTELMKKLSSQRDVAATTITSNSIVSGARISELSIRRMSKVKIEESKIEPPKCPVCLCEETDLTLHCGHQYHETCMLGQLNAGWTGNHITFGYASCAECREVIQTPEELRKAGTRYSKGEMKMSAIIKDTVSGVRRFETKVLVIAQEAAIEDEHILPPEGHPKFECKEEKTLRGSNEDEKNHKNKFFSRLFGKSKRHKVRQKVHRSRALSSSVSTLYVERAEARKLLDTFAVYVCTKCSEPYCGGRVECAQDMEVDPSSLKCQACVWSDIAGDHKCLEHGVQHAMFKCDSCCNVATYDCIYNHYCSRCHELASKEKYFPCPGPEKCPLGIPHPKNLSARHGGNKNRIDPFVIGCMACQTGISDTGAANPSYAHGYKF